MRTVVKTKTAMVPSIENSVVSIWNAIECGATSIMSGTIVMLVERYSHKI